jgi:TetR/AcrR family transcriptional repressor of nem operon
MRYPQGHKNESRARLISAIGRGFRRHGYAGIGVDGLAKEAEVTSGAFYGHFSSKDAAFKEVAIAGLDQLRQGVLSLREQHGEDWLERFVDFYLGFKRICDLGESCGLQSLSPEVGRADVDIRTAYEGHMQAAAAVVAEGLSGGTPADRQRRAWTILSLLAGGVTLARACGSEATAGEIAAAVKAGVLAIAGATSAG